MPRSLSRRARAVLIAAGLVLPLALLEGGARLVRPLALPNPPMYRRADGVGYELRPGFTGRGPSGEEIRIDADGLRSRAAVAPPAAGARRVLALGDSFVFGVGVAADDAFPAALENLLPAPARVANAGVPGYNLVQSVARLERDVPALAPDAVVLGFLENDLHDVTAPEYEAAPDGTLRRRPEAPSPRAGINPFQALSGPWLSLQLHSAFFRVASYALIRERLRTTGDAELDALARATAASDELTARLLRGELDDETRPRFAAAARLLERAAEVARRAGIPLVLVVFPRPEQLASEELRGGTRRVAEAARAAGITVVDPTAALAAEPDRIGLYLFPVDHHPSARGHAAIAREVARQWPG